MQKSSKSMYIAILGGITVIGILGMGKFFLNDAKEVKSALPVISVTENMLSNRVEVSPLSDSQIEAVVKNMVAKDIANRSKEANQPLSIEVDQKLKKVSYKFLRVNEDKAEQSIVIGEAYYSFKPLPKIDPQMNENEKDEIRTEIYQNPLGVVFNNRIEKPSQSIQESGK
ncbi:TPA: hypothetical protein JTH80_004351 [Escherichia coli]|nr:hypothetical protein [Salmonella enterica subsp. enterica serovar Enteritidis]EGO0752083.1 hypothetical protein [Shigella sonnei]HAX7705610.1 hypothetical protein [Escherichia coli]EEA2053042.1 hypothetical protein [Salmonella enterica subsp. enterica serovar Enteritidis]HAY3273463.1 hypothetical protein [Escherichia coli]